VSNKSSAILLSGKVSSTCWATALDKNKVMIIVCVCEEETRTLPLTSIHFDHVIGLHHTRSTHQHRSDTDIILLSSRCGEANARGSFDLKF
jgi:hypothetical protein